MKDYVVEVRSDHWSSPFTTYFLNHMRDTMAMTATIDQWLQFCEQPQMDGPGHALTPNWEGFSDAIVMTTSPTPTMPSESLSSTCGQLTPKVDVSKPIRRRSRASERTQTTLVNANTTNFRALVQQSGLLYSVHICMHAIIKKNNAQGLYALISL